MIYPEFYLTDFAKGDVRARNNVVPLKDAVAARSNGGAVNSYVTVYRFPEEYLEHRQRFGSVSGYAGPAYADYLPFDIDREGALHQALLAARGLAVTMQERFDVRPDQLRYFFSGAKGFHLLLPSRLFGNTPPSPHLPAAWRSMALAIADMAGEVIDAKIYDVNRLFRLPDTQHPSRLWKVELTWEEFISVDVEQIRELARSPRGSRFKPHDLEPVDGLVEFFAKHMEEAERPRVSRGPLRADGSGIAGELAAVLSVGFTQGQRHALVLAFAGYAAKRSLPRETALGVAELLLEDEPNVTDFDNLPTAINDTYDRVREGLQVKGYTDLQTYLPAEELAELARLLGDKAPGANEQKPDAPAAATPDDRVSLSHVYDADRAGRAYLEYVRQLQARRVNLGIPSLDRAMRGMMPGTVTIMLAKSRVGKSMFVQAVRRYIAKTTTEGCTVFFSLEMPVELVWERDARLALGMYGEEVENTMRDADEGAAESYIARVSRTIPRAYTVPVAGLSLADMLQYCELIQTQMGHRIGAVMIDYMSLVSSHGKDAYNATTAVARGLKPFAKRVDAPVLVLAQVRRQQPGADKADGASAPTLEDGRDSGAIEEGGDFVIGAWRPKLDDQYSDDEMALKLLKNRMGKAGVEARCRIDWKTLSMTELLPDELPHRGG